jgi:hypothetical protein
VKEWHPPEGNPEREREREKSKSTSTDTETLRACVKVRLAPIRPDHRLVVGVFIESGSQLRARVHGRPGPPCRSPLVPPLTSRQGKQTTRKPNRGPTLHHEAGQRR